MELHYSDPPDLYKNSIARTKGTVIIQKLELDALNLDDEHLEYEGEQWKQTFKCEKKKNKRVVYQCLNTFSHRKNYWKTCPAKLVILYDCGIENCLKIYKTMVKHNHRCPSLSTPVRKTVMEFIEKGFTASQIEENLKLMGMQGTSEFHIKNLIMNYKKLKDRNNSSKLTGSVNRRYYQLPAVNDDSAESDNEDNLVCTDDQNIKWEILDRFKTDLEAQDFLTNEGYWMKVFEKSFVCSWVEIYKCKLENCNARLKIKYQLKNVQLYQSMKNHSHEFMENNTDSKSTTCAVQLSNSNIIDAKNIDSAGTEILSLGDKSTSDFRIKQENELEIIDDGKDDEQVDIDNDTKDISQLDDEDYIEQNCMTYKCSDTDSNFKDATELLNETCDILIKKECEY